MMNKNILLWTLGILALFIIVSAVWYRYFYAPSIAYSSDNTVSATLIKSNQDYALARVYKEDGKYDLALRYYQKALLVAQDSFQATQIRLNIAIATELMGNYKDAILQLKEIAADTSNLAIFRAYAVQEIGLMHFFNYYKEDARQIIDAETFKDSPYDAFRKDSSVNMAYIKLFEYATSLYPLGNSEARIAYGYSKELLETLQGATTTPQGKAYLTLIEQSLRAADADFERTRDIPGQGAMFILDFLTREGIALGNLASVGAADPERAEPYFKSGLKYAASIGEESGSFYAYSYAAFLAVQYGTARSEDIKEILAPFRSGNDAEIDQDVVDFYKSAYSDPTLSFEKAKLILLGRIDTSFKTYLISLGWKQSIF